MSERVRVGIVGTSWWADYLYLPSLVSHPRAELVALCGRNQANAAELAKKYAVPGVFADYRELIEQADLDALIVATPDDVHYPVTMHALDAGLHVLCEKPMASNAGQAREMYEKAEAMGVKHMVLFTYRWMPQFQYLREHIDQGYLGRCFHASLRFWMGYGRDGAYRWRFDRRRANGVLGDLGSHAIDLARWYLGDITRVGARLATFVERPGADDQPPDPANDAALLMLEFASGAHATIEASAVARPTVGWGCLQVGLYGQAGTLEADLQVADTIRAAQDGEEDAQPRPIPDRLWGDADRSDPFEVLIKAPAGARQFVDAIVEDRPVGPTFYDGLQAQLVVDAALESHASGGWVTIR